MENRVKLQKGKIVPTKKDYLVVGVQTKSMINDDQTELSPAQLRTGAITEMEGTGRASGTKYHYQGEVVVTVDSQTSAKDTKDTVGRLSADGFTPKQIYQLAYYLNNSGMNLQATSGLIPSMHDCDIEILPRQNNGDMRVRARLSVVRYKETRKIGENAETVGIRSNEYIEHEFSIRTDGTLDETNIRFLRDPKMPKAAEVVVTIGA